MTSQTPLRDRSGSIWIWFGLFVVGAFYFFYARQHSPVIGFGDDPSVYLTSAKALASGHGYRLINFPDAPVAAGYPIGYPALLALLLRLFPSADPINVSGSGSVVMAYLWVVLTYLFLKRYMRSGLAGLVAIAMGLTQRVFLGVWGIMSEWPFALVVLAAVVVAERSVRDTRKVSDQAESRVISPPKTSYSADLGFALLAGLLITVAMLMRSMGITLVVGMAVFFVVNRRWHRLVAYLIGVAVVETPWMLWSRLHHIGGGLAGYIAQYRHEATIQTPFSNLHTLLMDTIPTTLFPFMDSKVWERLSHHGPVKALQFIVGIAIVVPAITGLIALLRQRNVIAYCCIPYLALVLIWPWDPVRFCIPLYPLFIVVVTSGIRELVALGGRYRSRPVTALNSRLRNVVVLSLVVSIISSLAQDAQWLRRLALTGSLSGSSGAVEWNTRVESLRFLQQNTPANALILTSFPCATYLFTGRHTVAVPDTGEELARTLKNMHGPEPVYVFATYRTSVAEYNYGTEFGLAPVNSYASTHPGTLTRLWSDADGKTVIYLVSPTHPL